MTAAARVTGAGGAIVVAARCQEGVGGEAFRELASFSKRPEEVLNYIRENEPIRDQWEVQEMEKVLLKARVYLVSEGVREERAEEMGLRAASSVEEVREGEREAGVRAAEEGKVVAIPEGPYAIPELKAYARR